MLSTFLVLLTIILYSQITVASNYCSSDVCNNSKEHTLCKFQSPVPAQNCIEHERTIQSREEKKALLDKINDRRNKIAAGDIRSFPSAESMIKLEWNEELEMSAQRWADQCIAQGSASDKKDTCRDLGKTPVGQNIATVYGESPGLSPLSLVDVWYMELLNINASAILRYMTSSDKGFSHYNYFTQLAWARSSEVGCGGVKFKERLEDGRKNRTVNRLVCNFAPSGNIVGDEVYSPGPPCSNCPDHSKCDLKYKALCNLSFNTGIEEDEISDFNVVSTTSFNDTVAVSRDAPQKENSTNSETTDDDNITFDYISHYFDFTRQEITTRPSTESFSMCKDILAVDEFVELLKKKLSTDPSFKELLLATKNFMQNGNGDYSFTDRNVEVFVSKIYSKKEPTTTTKIFEQDFVNSTLLVDLVEAVIFRSGDRPISTYLPEEIKQLNEEVNPVKIQAELAEIKQNRDFTGHYFFPEDSTEESITDTMDSYEDTFNSSVSDVVFEIEKLKRDKSTKDFLEEIIESDIATESESKRKRHSRYLRNVEDLDDSLIYQTDHSTPYEKMLLLKSNKKDDISLIKYGDMLKKIATDLKVLKLNERFHCCYNSTVTFYPSNQMISIIFFLFYRIF